MLGHFNLPLFHWKIVREYIRCWLGWRTTFKTTLQNRSPRPSGIKPSWEFKPFLIFCTLILDKKICTCTLYNMHSYYSPGMFCCSSPLNLCTVVQYNSSKIFLYFLPMKLWKIKVRWLSLLHILSAFFTNGFLTTPIRKGGYNSNKLFAPISGFLANLSKWKPSDTLRLQRWEVRKLVSQIANQQLCEKKQFF